MQTGALTEYLDVAQVVLYAFWVFFALLLFYLRQEDRREGYPLEHDMTGKVGPAGFPFMPDAKTFMLPHGGTFSAPNALRDSRPIMARKIGPWAGAPLEPTGNPLVDAVGPAAYAERADVPDATHTGEAKIVPIGKTHGYEVHSSDIDPRGLPVMGCDGRVAGSVKDVWVDQSEHVLRYYEVGLAEGGRNVLLPSSFVVFRNHPRRLYVNAITSQQFLDVPATKAADSVTLREEDRICGYYGGGMLYATPQRAEPLI
jgi:photosynthetic reaction center H subunit